jgi:ABC-2 type transport system ATP-binding protein
VENENGNGHSASGNELEVEFLGGEEAIADLLEVLINNKVRIASFSEAQSDLEDVFLRLTKGEVA